MSWSSEDVFGSYLRHHSTRNHAGATSTIFNPEPIRPLQGAKATRRSGSTRILLVYRLTPCRRNFSLKQINVMAENIPNTPGGAVPPKKETGKVQPKKETVRINLPPKPSAAPTIKLPTLPPGGPSAGPVPTAPAPSLSTAAPAHTPGAPRVGAAAPTATAAAPRPATASPRPAPAPTIIAPAIGMVETVLAIIAIIACVAAFGSGAYLVWGLP